MTAERMRFALFLTALLGSLLVPVVVCAAESAVNAILFYSPACKQCHKIMEEEIPKLEVLHGDKIQIVEINIREDKGEELYLAVVTRLGVFPLGIPTLVVGETGLIGYTEITEKFPGIILEGLQRGGIDWPDIPGFRPPPEGDYPPDYYTRTTVLERLAMDPVSSILAAAVSTAMVVSGIWIVVRRFRKQELREHPAVRARKKSWLPAVASVLGLILLAPIAYLEVNEQTMLPNPLNRCATVLQSSFIKIGDTFPLIFVMMFLYALILFIWPLQSGRVSKISLWADRTLLVGTGTGFLLSLYITIVQPLLIGATCLWSLGSSSIMSVLFILVWHASRTRDPKVPGR